MSSSDADYPYCGTISLTDIGYRAYNCFSERNQLLMAAVTPTETSRTTMTLDETTAAPSAAASSTSTNASGVDDKHKADEESSTSTAEITGGALGGVAFVAIAAALLFLVRRRKKKSPKEPTELSFSVIGLQASPSKVQDTQYQEPAAGRDIREPPSYANPVEVPSNLDQARDAVPVPAVPGPSASPDLTPIYQAYHAQRASAMTFSPNSPSVAQPVLSPQSSFYRPSQYASHGSFMPAVSEAHGDSECNSLGSSSSQTEVRNGGGRRFAEHGAGQFSSQSGPVSEWHM
ncbi:hypothetical protein LTR70_005034 [Exophiala xenobiotica]|uniref:Uncharacterized protein n=1 Tax=Lithohypha guttulata TaxID=1690604 RepID=A0ABR0K8M5_9EURO|nr:hypothetical protein LTR24_005510 [Lithohypha guttulata]KAK5319281.1 hypothetical protein LTR70_005034 [Exophiala xenobiotica]